MSLWDDKGEMVDTTGRLSKGGVPGNSYARATDGDGAWEYTAVGATTQGSSNDPTGAGAGDVEGGESGASAFAFSRSELGAAAAVGAAVGAVAMASFVLYSNKDAAAERWREWRGGRSAGVFWSSRKIFNDDTLKIVHRTGPSHAGTRPAGRTISPDKWSVDWRVKSTGAFSLRG